MCFPCKVSEFVFCVTTNLILEGIISCERSVFIAVTCSERILNLEVQVKHHFRRQFQFPGKINLA